MIELLMVNRWQFVLMIEFVIEFQLKKVCWKMT